jgi:ELWxxDGT repeat protein
MGVTIVCAVACCLAFAAPAMGIGEPSLVRDIGPGADDGGVYSLAPFDGRLYFTANDGVGGAELWSSDGTAAGTSLFKDIFPGPGSSYPIGLTDAFGELIFRAGDGVHGDEPWASDGTHAGTALVTDVDPGPATSGPFGLALGDSRAYFQADDGTTGNELWVYEGPGTETTLVKDLKLGADSGVQGGMLAVGDTVYFGGDNGTGRRLWKSNGTAAGTVQVSSQPFADVSGLVAMGGKLFFSGLTAAGAELWVSDGTALGTMMLKDIGPAASGLSLFAQAVELDGSVLFVADDGSGDKLWRTDGTPDGTELVHDDVRAVDGTLTVVDDEVYFAGGDDDTGRELWKSDGTEDGTEMVADIVDGTNSSLPEQLTAIGDTLFFSANDGVHGYELWTSDGTEASTKMVADVVDGPGSSFPGEITEAAGKAFFVADTFAAGQELWALEIDASPVAVGDAATVGEDAAPTAIPVLANDTDADGGAPKSVASVTQPANGEVAIIGGGSGITYEPDPDYCDAGGGTDDFAYTLAPGGDVAVVEVKVTCVDDAPVAVSDSAAVAENAAATAIPVLANDTDVDGGAPKTVGSVTQPANGEVVVTGGGTGLTYRPNAAYCNATGGPTDDFAYALSPGGDTATVVITVNCVDDAPDVPKPGIAVAGRTAKVERGVARLRLRCRGEGACEGRATLAVMVRRGKRTVRVLLGARRFAIVAGETKTLSVRVNRAGRSRLAKSPSGRLRVKLAGTRVKPRAVVLKAG